MATCTDIRTQSPKAGPQVWAAGGVYRDAFVNVVNRQLHYQNVARQRLWAVDPPDRLLGNRDVARARHVTNAANNTSTEQTRVIAVADLGVIAATTTAPLEVLIGQTGGASLSATIARTWRFEPETHGRCQPSDESLRRLCT